jgi:integrase
MPTANEFNIDTTEPPQYSAAECTLANQSERWLYVLRNRKRRPVSLATIATAESRLRQVFRLISPNTLLQTFDNAAMAGLVNVMLAQDPQPAPSTIALTLRVIKSVIASAKDEHGKRTFPRDWDAGEIDCPEPAPTERKGLTRQQVEALLTATEDVQERALYVVLLGSGLRISEAQGLRLSNTPGKTSWIEDRAVIEVRNSLYQNQERDRAKTAAAKRCVFLCRELNEYIAEFGRTAGRQPGELVFQANGRPLLGSTIRYRVGRHGISCHHMRKFRTTHLLTNKLQLGLVKDQVGHSRKSDITDGVYNLLDEDVVRREIERVGLGFSLKK